MVSQSERVENWLRYLQELVGRMMRYGFTEYLLTLELFEHLSKKVIIARCDDNDDDYDASSVHWFLRVWEVRWG